MVWWNLSTLSLIGWTGVNGDESYFGISSKLLIKDQSLNLTATHKFSFLYSLPLFVVVKHYWIFNWSNLLDSIILDSFPHPVSVWNQDFVERIGRICCLDSNFFIFWNVKWRGLFWWLIWWFKTRFWVRLHVFLLVCHLITLNFNFKAYISLILWNLVIFSLFEIEFSLSLRSNFLSLFHSFISPQIPI